MQPIIHVNWPAVIAAIVANFILGSLWYGPLFGKTWARLVGFPPDFKPEKSAMMRGMILMVIGSFLTVFCLVHASEVWRPSVWKVGADGPNALYGFMSGFFTWLGFIVPLLFGSVAWEGKSWKLFAINAAYWFVSLQVIGMITAFWR